MAKKNKNWLEQLEYGKVVAYNVYERKEIRELLEPFGYDEKRFKDGITFYKKAEEFHYVNQTTQGEVLKAIAAFNAAKENADKTYMILIKIARVALQGDVPTLQKLHLNGDRERAFSKWLTQARQFYSGALEEPLTLQKLKDFGISKERLKGGKKLLEIAEAAHVRKELKKGEALASTQKRNAAFQKMNRWVADVNRMNRIAREEKGLNPKNLF